MTGLKSEQTMADFPTQHYGASYKSKIPDELKIHVPTAVYHFEVIPSYKKDNEPLLSLRKLTVKSDNEFMARRDAHEKAHLGAWEKIRLSRVEPNPEYIAHRAECAKYI